MSQGAWEHKTSPWVPQGNSLSHFVQSYLRPFCVQRLPADAGGGQAAGWEGEDSVSLSPCVWGDAWCRQNKLRRIRLKLSHNFKSAHECVPAPHRLASLS